MDNITYTTLPITDFLHDNSNFTGRFATTYGGFLVTVENGIIIESERIIEYKLTDYIQGIVSLDDVTFKDSSGKFYTTNRGVAHYTIPHAIVVPDKLLHTLDIINPYVGAYIWDQTTGEDFSTKSFINPITIEELHQAIKDKESDV